jgi:hypothetical protein
MNQQGALSGQKCWSSQNGRGGTFYVINDAGPGGERRRPDQGRHGAAREIARRPDSCRGDNLQSPRPRHCFARMIGER